MCFSSPTCVFGKMLRNRQLLGTCRDGMSPAYKKKIHHEDTATCVTLRRQDKGHKVQKRITKHQSLKPISLFKDSRIKISSYKYLCRQIAPYASPMYTFL